MKKLLVVLGMITCMLGVTACGSEKVAESPKFMEGSTDEDLANYCEGLVQAVVSISATGTVEQYSDYAWILNAVTSYDSAAQDMGNYTATNGSEVELSEDGAIVTTTVSGDLRDAKIETIFDEEGNITSMTTNVVYSFGELMAKAGLNTLLGMGTVFAVLILISLIISLFQFIPKIQAAFSKKDSKEAIKKDAVKNTIAQISEREELSDDLELVAVISAAIAASEGAANTDGFVVRSIRKANKSKWQNA